MEPPETATVKTAAVEPAAAKRRRAEAVGGREGKANKGRCQNRNEGSHGTTPLKAVAPGRSSHHNNTAGAFRFHNPVKKI